MERLDGGVLEVLDGLGFTVFSNTENLPMVVTVKEVHVLKCPVTCICKTYYYQTRQAPVVLANGPTCP